MTGRDAKKVATIIGTADGGCSHCAEALAEKMQALFPEHDWMELMVVRDGDDAMEELGYQHAGVGDDGAERWVPLP